MPPLPQATAAALARRARDLLKDAAELTSGTDPNYIRDAEPDSIFEAIPLAGARQGCRRYASNPGEYSGRRLARVERACRPYLDSLEPGLGPEVEIPFKGGQCDGACYRIGVTNASGANEVIQARGPIGGVRGVTLPGGGRLEIFARSEVNFTNSVSCLPLQPPGWVFGGLGGTQWNADSNPRITSIVRADGGADDCGNPPPDYRGPRLPSVPLPPGPNPFTRLPDIDIEIEVEINPDLTFDIDFGTGPITIDPFGDEGGAGGAGGPGTPGSPSDTGPGGEAEGEAGEGQILTGLRIDFVDPPVGGNEYAPGVFRAVCYIYMGTAEGLDHDPAGAMLRSGQFVYAEKDFLTRWVVSANAGYNLRVTPYYRPEEGEG